MLDAAAGFFDLEGGGDRPAGDSVGVQGELYLRFVLATGEEFVLPAMGVQEVAGMTPDRISAVPNVPPVVMGAYNWRGQVIWVGDLGQFLGMAPLNTNRAEISVIVVADQGVTCGLAVDRVVGTEFLDPRQLRPPLSPDLVQGNFLVQGEWFLGEGLPVMRLLEPKALVDSRLWFSVA
ncbi:Chemotaxis signal transduction protein [Gloeomargarita lithophora Alchichica-D10]|uniref:Chemotaxis signal transduction protein n=1 Tax=Gloeomargarita lithophora Alchichica-D10 TaxID=1188229 RepID=A0A1J0AF83_9CYAN|nr:chemotaxis protein CheW [Gloeomargarita lithophora]APB34567.1 Chemotaxis signal transduction protein [Gloeomargarita lithophora Alchichica-D10]